MIKKPFSKTWKKYKKILEFVHSDIYELNSALTKGENRYFIIFIDDVSRYTEK